MPTPQHLNPSSYRADGGSVGVLLIHGFTGSVAETRPLGQYLAARGLTVRCPLLPGHGTNAQDLTRIRWKAWVDAVDSVLCDLQHHCEAVFVGGLSLGALLTLWLGAKHPEIDGLIPMAPAIQVRSWLFPLTLGLRYLLKYNPLGAVADEDWGDPEAIQRVWCYDETPLWGAAEAYLLQRRVRNSLSSIHQPILIFQGRRDAVLPSRAAQIVFDGVSSQEKRLVWLERSGHNLLVDGEREAVWARSYTWILEHAGLRQG
jgi:carboxylesterase